MPERVSVVFRISTFEIGTIGRSQDKQEPALDGKSLVRAAVLPS
jgi:hypothetical protein